MKELNNKFKINPQAEGFSPELSLHEVSLQSLPGSRLYSQQDGGALGLEQLRALQVHLMDLHRTKPFKRVLITSAVRGEGKTHVAANLSLSLAAEGFRRVLVIDTDVRNSSLHLAFGIPNLFGFKDCLSNENKCWNAVQKVKDFELYVMTGGIGSCTSIGPARIASIQMMLEQLEPSFDLIILDSPPLLGGVDGKVLSNVADAILVVVGSGRAPRHVVMEAQQSLQRDRILGVVLNRLDPGMACFRSYSDYNSEHSANGRDHKRGRRKKDVIRRRESEAKDFEPEPDDRPKSVIPISLHEEPIREPRETLVSSMDISSPDRRPNFAVTETPHGTVSAAPPEWPKMRDLITGAVSFETQTPPHVESPRHDAPGAAAQQSTLPPQKNRRRRPDGITTVLLLAIVALAGVLGWALGHSGGRYYRRQGNPATQPAPVQGPAPVQSQIEHSVSGVASTALTTPPATQQAGPAAPLQKASKALPAGLAVHDHDKPVRRSDGQSQGNYTRAGSVDSKPAQSVTSASTTLRIPSGTAREYLTSEVAPEYPEPAREGHIQGAVVLNVQVGKNGRVEKLTTISGNPLLAAAATDGVQQWRFRPFYRNGQPQEFETQVTVNFKIPHP